MCGFVGLWKTGDRDLAETMINRLRHRGPDAMDIHVHDATNMIMAHSRLSIIGTEDGAQPIYQGDDILVVNGEIYNHEDLRAILGKTMFKSASDSESILHLFRSGKLRWIERLDGMFAFVLATKDRIIAARDPLGIKPLFIGYRDGGIGFASELKAFDGLGFHDIQMVPPGHLFDSLQSSRRWYRLPAGLGKAQPDSDTHEDIATELRYVLEEAVAKWMTADVEVGSFLSGGLDSSIIAAIASHQLRAQGKGPLKTFSVGTKGSPDVKAAQAVAEHIGSDHHVYEFTAQDIVDDLSHVIYHLESADVDLVRSAIPTLYASRLARQHVKAVLTGEGADELFAGYTYHHEYSGHPDALAKELTRTLGTMHNINLQRVDRISMSESLEARTPFLDRDLINFAQSIPADLKMRETDPNAPDAIGETTEKWILRKACEDLLPHDLVWRKKAQFDEGSGTVDALTEALQLVTGENSPLDKTQEAEVYKDILYKSFEEPDMIMSNAGTWEADRVLT